MPTQPIASGKNGQCGWRRQYVDLSAAWPAAAPIVAGRRPMQQRVPTQRKRSVLKHHERAIGQAVNAAPMPALGTPVEPLSYDVHSNGKQQAVETRPQPRVREEFCHRKSRALRRYKTLRTPVRLPRHLHHETTRKCAALFPIIFTSHFAQS